MKALTLQQANVAPGEWQRQVAYGRSLTSNYSPVSLENKFLAQTSTVMPQQTRSPLVNLAASSSPSLQPSQLSSTSSSLLSASSLAASLSSPLLSTQNKLLTAESPRLSFPLTFTVPTDLSLCATSSAPLLSRFSQPSSFVHHGLGREQERGGGEDVDQDEISEEMQACFEETSGCSEEDDDVLEEEEVDDPDAGRSMELPVVETELGNQELEETVVVEQEEFAAIESGNEEAEEELTDKKYLLLNIVCCSLVNKRTPPGQKDWDSETSVWTKIINLAKDISVHDPQFLLKVAVYSRQKLNIRITTNFLLALAANLPQVKPYVRSYFCASVQLPSDWLEVVRIYSTCFSRSLPMCLKKAMADKFKQFSEYQLAKYNTRKHRCKHNRNRRIKKKPTDDDIGQWANMVLMDKVALRLFLKTESNREVVDKKQSEFSVKKMIKKFHIKEPAEHVMAILGKRYPADIKAFTRSGIKGAWDRERAGQRMKLKEPQTWERLLSLEGNKAATWEKLIDGKSLPFMAMLRNLRNMITTGISEAHHKKILSRLTNEKAVIQSRQFPFRFLAAYKVIMELNAVASASLKAMPSSKEILVEILKKFPKGKRYKSLEWEKASRSRTRMALGTPFVCRLYHARKTQLLKANQRLFTVALLDRYCKALETAVQISCRYNVPPLPGRTIVVLPTNAFYDDTWNQKFDFCLPPDPEQKPNEATEEEEEEEGRRRRNRRNKGEDDKLTPTKNEVAALLSLMISSSAEDCRLFLTSSNHCEEAVLKSDVLLENVRSVVKQMKACWERSGNDKCDYLSKMLTKKNKVNNIITVSDTWFPPDINWTIESYRNKVNTKALEVQILLSAGQYNNPDDNRDRNCVQLAGFSEQMLRFVAERGSSRLLEHVENLGKLYRILPPQGDKGSQSANKVVSIPATPKLRWRSVRVFISSTFRDMHSERDVLVRSVFPELRRRAVAQRLYLQEVELRWGVTEEESRRAVELCLSEVCRSQMLVGILGERYGLVPPRPVLPDLPQYSWLASAPDGLSITEMEIRQFQALYPDTADQRMFCYFRDPNISRSVPVAWRSDFASESKDAEDKMNSLKRRLLDSDVKVTENYSCEWGGVVEGKPHLKNLEDFGRAVLEDLWTAVMKLFVEEDDEAEPASEVFEQEVHQEALRRQFFGRSKLLSGAVEIVEQAQIKGGMVVVEGGAGEGKTVFMAALADALRTGNKTKNNLTCDVLSYSTSASLSARSGENLLRCLVHWLRKMKDTEEESPLPHSYKDLLSEFHSTLSGVKKSKPLMLLVDGADLVWDGRGQLCSDWIPQPLPQGVCLVVSVASKAGVLQTLTKKKGAVPLTLGQLTVPDRKEIVQKELDAFGKKLSDSAFNNQLQTLIMKQGAASPLYLHLACADLRNFASFDKLKESLQGLPQTLGQLVQYSLERLCSQYEDMPGLRWALAALAVSTTGLKERDLYSLLNTCNDLSSGGGPPTWQEVLHLARKPKGRAPMATFTRVVQSVHSLISPSHCHDTDDLLALTNPEVRRAFEDFLLPTEGERTRAHLVLAGHLWTLADPQGRDTFLNCEANSVLHLPSSLIQSGQLEALHSLLSSYYFLYANVRHGLLHQLLETYRLYDNAHTSAPSFGSQDRLEDCRCFLQRHAPTLSSWPALFIQQALDEPQETAAHAWARGLVGKGGVRVVECLNKRNGLHQETGDLVSTFLSEPTCLVVSSDEDLMVVGTGRGTLHFINTHTGQEVRSVVSMSDGISSCVLLKDRRLATTSFDGRIELWDTEIGCRSAHVDGHTNSITASDATVDKKHFATVSLDFMLKVWSSTTGKEVASLLSISPMNCVTFDPEGQLLAAGCWNGNVILWNWLQNKTQTFLRGHQQSVRSLAYSPSSSMLCSGSVSGEVRVWSVPTSTCVGCFQAHCGATEALAFLEDGAMLLSGGSDHTLQLWSGGLGRSVAALKSDECEQEPPQKKLKSVTSEPAALCVAVTGDCAAVGYHGEGMKLFSLGSGEMIWSSSSLDVSVPCLLWIFSDAMQTEPELLVSAGSDKRLRVWKRKEEEEGGLISVGMFGVQTGVILALAQNSTYLATASDDFTIVLWLLSDLSLESAIDPHVVLRGHKGGVSCLAFSPDGARLLSGGKDQALMVWDVSSSPAALSKSLLHSHRDWITGCVWTPDCVISSSNDGRLCLWDLEAGQCLKEISWRSPLTSVCCLGQHVMAGCAEGALHVWNWETKVEICHIAAHKQRIHHCSLLPSTDKEEEAKPEEMTVVTASGDGSVQLWKPLQVEHFSTFHGHSGAIHGVFRKEGVPEFLTVSEDRSLRTWTWTTESPPNQKGTITSLCFSQSNDVVLAGYDSGLLELWLHGAVVGRKQASDGAVTAVCSMPDDQFAVAYGKRPVIDVWKLVWKQQHGSASLVKVTTHTVKYTVEQLIYCTTLIGLSNTGTIFGVACEGNDWLYTVTSWDTDVHIQDVIRNDEKSAWLLGDKDGEVRIGFFFTMGRDITFNSAFSSVQMKRDKEKGGLITAATVDKDFVVCGDVNGNMWFNEPPEISSWSKRKPAHTDRISVLRLTDSTIISASYDRTVKLWDRNTKRQVGMFVCGGPVLILEVNPGKPTELVCGDGQGKLYFLSWKE